jgi:tRNA-dihydrouridine synthase B
MRAGWNDQSRNAPELARMVQDAGASAVTIHGRTAEQSYRGVADWELVSRVAEALDVPVLGSGDCVEPQQILDRLATGVSGVLVGRGVLRNPWILAQAADMASGQPARLISNAERSQFLIDYVTLLMNERVNESTGFRHGAPQVGGQGDSQAPARGRERWVINKLRALCGWYSKGLEGGAEFRTTVNGVQSVQHLIDVIHEAFVDDVEMMPAF